MAPPTQRHRGICPHLEHNFVTQFPQYGFKRPLLSEPASARRSRAVTTDSRLCVRRWGPRSGSRAPGLKAPAYAPGTAEFVPTYGEGVGCHGVRGSESSPFPSASRGSSTGPSLAHGYRVRGVLSTTPDPPGLGPPRAFTFALIRAALPYAGALGWVQVLPCFATVSLVSMPPPIRRKGASVRVPIASRDLPVFAPIARARPLQRSR